MVSEHMCSICANLVCRTILFHVSVLTGISVSPERDGLFFLDSQPKHCLCLHAQQRYAVILESASIELFFSFWLTWKADIQMEIR